MAMGLDLLDGFGDLGLPFGTPSLVGFPLLAATGLDLLDGFGDLGLLFGTPCRLVLPLLMVAQCHRNLLLAARVHTRYLAHTW